MTGTLVYAVLCGAFVLGVVLFAAWISDHPAHTVCKELPPREEPIRETLKPIGSVTIQERIYSAAIWYKDLPTSTIPLTDTKIGIIVRGHRHADIIHTVYNLLGKRTCTHGADCTGEHEQGFVTNKGRFVDRKEAMLIARTAGQLINPYATDTLYSEDLY